MLIEFFEHSAKPHGQYIYPVCLHAHKNTVKFLETASIYAYIAIAPYVDEIDIQDRKKRMKAFVFVLRSISTALDRALQSDRLRESMYLFYTSAMYVRCLYCLMLSQDSQDRGYISLLTTIQDLFALMRNYKKRTIDVGEFEPHLEQQYKEKDAFYYKTSSSKQSSRFSPEWWSFLDGHTSNCRVPLSTKLQVAMAGRLHRPKFKMGKLVDAFAETHTGLGVHANNPVSILRALVTSSAGNLRARLHEKSASGIARGIDQPRDTRHVEPASVSNSASTSPVQGESQTKNNLIAASSSGPEVNDQNEEEIPHQDASYSQHRSTIHHGGSQAAMNPRAHDFV